MTVTVDTDTEAQISNKEEEYVDEPNVAELCAEPVAVVTTRQEHALEILDAEVEQCETAKSGSAMLL